MEIAVIFEDIGYASVSLQLWRGMGVEVVTHASVSLAHFFVS